MQKYNYFFEKQAGLKYSFQAFSGTFRNENSAKKGAIFSPLPIK
jgi:hypothetical protein